jgi:hypothetical protein
MSAGSVPGLECVPVAVELLIHLCDRAARYANAYRSGVDLGEVSKLRPQA